MLTTVPINAAVVTIGADSSKTNEQHIDWVQFPEHNDNKIKLNVSLWRSINLHFWIREQKTRFLLFVMQKQNLHFVQVLGPSERCFVGWSVLHTHQFKTSVSTIQFSLIRSLHYWYLGTSNEYFGSAADSSLIGTERYELHS